MKLPKSVLLLAFSACPAPQTAVVAVVDAGISQRWVASTEAAQSMVLEAPARVVASPRSSAQLTAVMRATVMGIRVRAGDRVDAGAPVLDVVMPEVLDAAGRFEGAKLRLAAWSERQTQLKELKAEGLTRSLDVSEAAARVAEARAELQTARATLLVAGVREGDVAGLLNGPGTIALRTPVSGIVTELSVSLGESKEPTSGPLVTVSGEGPVRIEARFARPPPDGTFAFIAGHTTIPLRLVSRAPTADARDGSSLVWFEPIENTEKLPTAGTLGRVTVRGDQPAQAAVVAVPSQALRRTGSTVTVVTAAGPRVVDVLNCSDAMCLVRGEVAVGQQVLVEDAR